MGEVLNKPFVSEAYDRLMADQAKAHPAIAIDPSQWPASDLNTPVTDIRAARERLGLTQAAMGEALGVDGPRLSAWENGKPLPRYIDLAVRCLLAMEAVK